MISVLIPAYNEADRIADTLAAVQSFAAARHIQQIIVVDDGSTDNTSERAQAAGADVVFRQHNGGKGAALNCALNLAQGDILLLLDADLGASATEAARLLDPVVSGAADMSIATFPRNPGKGGGVGLVVKLARWGIHRLTGQTMQAPLSGQRAVRRQVLEDAGGFAEGWGVEVALTVHALQNGYRVLEIPTQMSHRVTGRSPAAILHRGQQFLAALRALLKLGVLRPEITHDAEDAASEGASAGMISPQAIPVYAAVAWAVVALPALAEFALRRVGHIEPNFRGERIPQSFGIVIVLGAAPLLLAIGPLAPLPFASVLPWLVVLLGFGLLGMLDDFRGDKKIKGLRGHFRAAFAERRITTGFIKAIGGAAIALGLGFSHFPHSPAEAVLAGALIALSANAINLFDLRPGRAGAAFLLCAFTLIALGWQQKNTGALCLLCVCLPALMVYSRDRRALAMMGDTGSNPLGACLGLALVEQPSLPLRIAALLVLIALHVVAEKFSLTKLIERFAPLRALDRLTGVR